ncbi:MAG: CinA family protein [Gammaproteobacteria bacterium]|nr:CinA family protein [Gammaproteobacteria bacterium]
MSTVEQQVTEQALKEMAEQLGACMTARALKLASAESCTGGWLAKVITDIPGSSAWFTGSVVSYSNESKQSLLGVAADTLKEFGAVSGETVLEMSDGLLARTEADVVVSISGVAGPDGGSDDKPVGLVWLSWGRRGKSTFASPFHFDGDRKAVRKQSIAQALNSLLDLLVCD